MKKTKKSWRERTPWKYFRNKKILAVYCVLRLLVIFTLLGSLLNRKYENAFICILTLILFVIPSLIERRLRIDFPDTLECIILFFIFAAEILGEIQEFYLLVPHWDTVLHTINGFLFAAIGFSIVDLLNEDKHIAMSLSPLCMAVVAFCFSMTIGVLWEFFEWGMDMLVGTDMQKDTIMHGISSVMLHPDGRNEPVALEGITNVIVTLADGTQVPLNLGGYLDIGLMDTMKDLLVNLIGAVVFSVIGYFYVRSRGKGKIAGMFIPKMMPPDADGV